MRLCVRRCVFFTRGIRVLICVCARSQTVQALEVVPWATDEPSFSAELARIVEYVTRPEVGRRKTTRKSIILKQIVVVLVIGRHK